jgi:hypothetical protein
MSLYVSGFTTSEVMHGGREIHINDFYVISKSANHYYLFIMSSV